MFDNSHFAGDLALGVKVCFEDGVSNKKLYRKYLIKGDNKKDDLASMREVVYRRLFKIVSENDYKPDLIIVDGGLNQLNEVKEIITNLNLDNVNKNISKVITKISELSLGMYLASSIVDNYIYFNYF